jgi:hypothetical protein
VSEEQGKVQVLKMGKCSPDNPEVVSVEVPRLQLVLGVLEHDLDELVQVEPDDGRPGARRRPAGRPRREAVPLDDVGDVVVVRKLERRVGDDEGHAVDRAPPPAGESRRRAREHQRPRGRDGSVVEGALRVGPCRAGREVPPERARLVDGPVVLPRRAGRQRARRPGGGAGVVQRSHRREVRGGEARGHDDGVVQRRLVERDEERERLAGVDVEGVVHVLHGVRPLHLHQPEAVSLDPDVDGGPEPDVGDAEQVRPAAGADERRRRLDAVDEQAVGRRQGAAGVEALPELPVSGLVPVPDEEREVPRGRRVRDGDGGALVDVERAEPPGGAVEREGGEVGEGADLVLGLELVGVVGAGGDGAVGPRHAVLPRVLALLDAVPGEEEGLVEVVDDVDDEVVVGDAVDARARELPVDQDALRRMVAVGSIGFSGNGSS